MIDPGKVNSAVVYAVCAFLVIEAVYGIMNEMKKSQRSTLSQAATWIKSLLMITFAVILGLFFINTETSVSVSGY